MFRSIRRAMMSSRDPPIWTGFESQPKVVFTTALLLPSLGWGWGGEESFSQTTHSGPHKPTHPCKVLLHALGRRMSNKLPPSPERSPLLQFGENNKTEGISPLLWTSYRSQRKGEKSLPLSHTPVYACQPTWAGYANKGCLVRL